MNSELENRVNLLIKAGEQVHAAWLKFGPVDNGSPEGDMFAMALTMLGGRVRDCKKLLEKRKQDESGMGCSGYWN